MRVKILLCVPNEKAYGPATMVLDTIREGYPTAFVDVYWNPTEGVPPVLAHLAHERALDKSCAFHYFNRRFDHAEWLRDRIVEHASDIGDSEPLIFVDGDVMFHHSCEDWKFDTYLAGYGVPSMWNDFARCRSFARLHTSHLWLSHPRAMLEHVRELVPTAFSEGSNHCPLDIFSPRIMVVDKEPFFWDSMSVAYQLLGGTPFGPEHLDCYDHLTSASAYDLVLPRLENKKGFEFLHTEGYKDAALLKREMWRSQNAYYAQKANQFKP